MLGKSGFSLWHQGQANHIQMDLLTVFAVLQSQNNSLCEEADAIILRIHEEAEILWEADGKELF